MSLAPAAPGGPAGRWAGLGVAIAYVIVAAAVGLYRTADTGPLWPDAPRYANAGAMVRDWLRSDQWLGPVRFAEAKGARTLAELRALSWERLATPVPATTGTAALPAPIRFGVVIDGHVLRGPGREVFASGQQNDVPTLTGRWSGSPVTLIMPAKACISGSYPGRSFNGPLAPNAPIVQYTRSGLSRRSVSASSPKSPADPGRRFWITTSPRSTISRRRASRSDGSFRLTIAERLLRLRL